MFQDQRVGDDEHQRNGQLAGLEQRRAGVAVEEGRDERDGLFDQASRPSFARQRPHVAIDEVRRDEGPDRGNGGGLGRREDALFPVDAKGRAARAVQKRHVMAADPGKAVKPAHDDDHQEQPPEGIGKARPDLAPAQPFALGQVLPDRPDQDRRHQHEARQKPRKHPRQEHPTDRDIGGRRIDDHDDRGWDQDAEGPCVADHPGGEVLGIAHLPHRRDDDGADGDHCRR